MAFLWFFKLIDLFFQNICLSNLQVKLVFNAFEFFVKNVSLVLKLAHVSVDLKLTSSTR